MAARRRKAARSRRPRRAKTKPRASAKTQAKVAARKRGTLTKRAKPKRAPRANRKRAAARARVREPSRGDAAQPGPQQTPAASGSVPVQAPPVAAPRPFASSLAVLASAPVRIGTVRDYFARRGVALVTLDGPLAVGERIHVRGPTSDFLAEVRSLRAHGTPVAHVASGEATLALPERARPGDTLFALRAPV